MVAATKKPKGAKSKAEAKKSELKKKWERQTGVPDALVTKTYLERYRKLDGALSVDELRASQEHMTTFIGLLPDEHAGVDPSLLGKQLESLRKTGAIKLGTGRVGPSKGYKSKTVTLLKNVLAESGIPAEKQAWIVEQVESASKEGLTPSQLRILHTLKDEPEGLTRTEIAKRAELSQSMTLTLGRSDGGTEGDSTSLSALGYVKASVDNEGRKTVVRYAVTNKGRKAIE